MAYWIIEEDELCTGGAEAKCSHCKYGYPFGSYFEPDQFNYCPNCGEK